MIQNTLLTREKLLLSLLLLLICNLSMQGQKKNLVWREDFGVAADSVRMDFADPKHTMPGHKCNLDTAVSVNDGTYAIMSSTAWAFPGNPSQRFFKMGRDHTGNKDGAMLVVNTDGRMVDKVIYEQSIDFPLCSANKYHFSMFAASITSFTCLQASLEIVVLGNGTEIIARKETGDIPWWESVNEMDKYSEDPMTVRQWEEYGVDFDSEGYKSITIQIINRAKCTEDGRDPATLQDWEGCDAGNDFAIDDISLYRYDQDEVPETEVASTTVTSQNKLNADCIYTSSYSIPLTTLESWQKIYPSVYFLWQVSEDGHTWANMEAQSGVNKMEMETEADATKTLRYRVIITGGMTEAEGKEVALQIAEKGGPDDGCYKYSISNTLAAAKMQADCSYNSNLKKIWVEDFGSLDSFATKAYNGVGPNMKLFDKETDTEFKAMMYTVSSAADTAIYIEKSWNKYPEKDAKGLAKTHNNAYLYMRFAKATATASENVLIDKAINGPFCNCKSFLFSFSACNPGGQWTNVQFIGRIIDEEGNILGEETFKVRGSENGKAWSHNTVAFDIPKNYKKSIHVQIINDNPEDYARLAIDNLEVAICGDILPEATVGIDKSTLTYLSGFDCSEEPYHTFGALNTTEWKHQFPDFGCAWQYSIDGGENWEYYATGVEQTYDNGEGGLTEFRAIFAETEAIAEEIAKQGKPSDPCDAFVFSNSIGLDCKLLGCKAPVFAFSSKDTVDICNDSEEKVSLSVEKKNNTNVDGFNWFTSPAGKNTWNLLESEKALTINVLPNESTDYLFIATNDTCHSDSIFARINVHEAISLEMIKDTTLCINSDLDLKATVLSGEPTLFVWNNVAGKENSISLEGLTEKQTVTLSATDEVCTSKEMEININIEDSVRIDISIDKTDICMGEDITLTINTKEDDSKVYSLKKSEYGLLSNMVISQTITEKPENPTLFTLTGTSKYCPKVEKSVNVEINEIPSAPTGTLRIDYLTSDEENGSFKNLLEQNPNAVVMEPEFTYQWYDAQEQPISSVPTPNVPAADNTEDISYTFFIDRTSPKGCVSQKAKVVVNIFSAPAPLTKDLEYCLNEPAEKLTAEISIAGNNSAEDFNLIWYASKETTTALTEAPTPSTEEESSTTYYVSQKHKTTNAESGRIPLTVTVHKVDKPILGENKTSYCKEDETLPLVATATSSSNTLVWTLDGEKTSANSINTYVNATTTYNYKVHQAYSIAENHICEGPEESIDITVTSVKAPTGTFSVNYTRLEAENNNGLFANNLLAQDENVAKADDNHTLLWYNENKELIGETAPTPTYDANWEAGQVINFTYYVAQRENGSNCIGEMKEVTVSINDAPTPIVSNLDYCLHGKSINRSFAEDLMSVASINTIPGGDPISHYRLVWFDTEDGYKTNINSGSNEPIRVIDTEIEGEQYFYVCQINTLTEAISTPSKIKVTIHPLPSITTKVIPTECSYDGEIIEIDLNNGLDHTNDAIAYDVEFFSTGTLTESINAIVKQAGSYYAMGHYSPIEGLTCYSEPQKLTVEIQELSTPIIAADATVCPGSTVTLEASATSQNTDGLIQYSWSCSKPNVLPSNNNYQITTSNLSENYGETYSFTVTASSGICQKESAPHTVTIGDAPLEGSLVITESGVDQPIGVVSSQENNEFYACGGDLTFTTDFTTTTGNYLWSNGQVGATVTETGLEGDKTYKLSFTNKCPTSVEFTIHTIPVSLFNELQDFNGCEGEALAKTLEVNCKEENYQVTWKMPNGQAQTSNGKAGCTIAIDKTSMSDNGTFEYEVTNRACKINGSFEAKVKEAIKFEASETTILERGRDTTLRINFTEGKPQLVEWKENGSTVNLEDEYTIRTITEDHTYEITMSDPNYCDTKTSMNILVDASLVLSTTLKDSICATESTTLIVDTTGTGACRDRNKTCTLVITENNMGAIKDVTNQARLENGVYKMEVSPTQDATYTATLTYGSQKKESSNSIIVLQPIEIKEIPQPSVCGDESISFEIVVSPSEATIEWEEDESIRGDRFGNAITVAPTFSIGNNHKEMHAYNFTVSYAFCTPKTGTVNVSVDEPLSYGYISGDKIICIGNSTNLSASSFEASSYVWNNADSSTTSSINVAPDTTTLYTVDMTRGKCTAKAEFLLNVASLPVILSIDSVGIRSRFIKTESGPGTQPFNYWVDNKEASENALINDLTFSKHIAYVEDANGCKTEMEFKMGAPTLQFKNFFSPNGDGINDTWDIASLEELYPNATIKIFDRNGKLIFESTAAEGSWDGTYNGKLMPSTDYWYEINIQEIKKLYVGHFTLIRSN
ncbi:MAG: T9SS type B sorting domain-containing protein [Paludibacteraceae bacterium]|nr:T9SS type B sorting domain-containing protein [Paludibacteraceae bacterium]